jgi:hypothetical protein
MRLSYRRARVELARTGKSELMISTARAAEQRKKKTGHTVVPGYPLEAHFELS